MVRNTWMRPPLLAKLVRHGWKYKSLPKLLQTCNPSSNYLEKICGSVEQIIRDPFLIVIKIQVERLCHECRCGLSAMMISVGPNNSAGHQ